MATESGNSYTISRTSQYFTPGTSFDISLVYDRDNKVVYEKIAVSVASGSITFVIILGYEGFETVEKSPMKGK